MGAWGVGVYDNDDAADWVALLQTDGLCAVEAAIDTVLPRRRSVFRRSTGSIESWDGACALAAADVIARLCSGGGETSAYSEDVVRWVEENTAVPSPELIDRARQVVAAVRGHRSELAALWAETGDQSDWLATVDDVTARLARSSRR